MILRKIDGQLEEVGVCLGGSGGSLPESDFILSPSSLSLTTESKTQTSSILVISGDGELSISNSDPTICTATLSGTTITVTGLGSGTSTITVIMAGTSQYTGTTRTLEVTCSAVDGSTVTPINDVPTWLKCIWTDKTYTTLSEVIADSQCLLALISDENAVDYMVRSTGFIVGKNIFNGKISLSDCHINENGVVVGPDTNNYVTDFIKVTPSSTVTLSSSGPASSASAICWYDANYTFIAGQKWNGNTTVTLNLPATAHFLKVSVRYDWSYFQIEYGSSATTYEPYQSIVGDALAMLYIGEYNYCADTLLADSTWCSAIANSEYFESVLNIKIPTMTSNTTPSGVASSSGMNSGQEGNEYKAFDDSISSSAQILGTSGKWLQYEFASNVLIKAAKLTVLNNTVGYDLSSAEIYRDNTSLGSFADLSGTVATVSFASNSVESTTYRLYANSNTTNYPNYTAIRSLQLYGREDVVAPTHELKTFATANDAEILEMVCKADRGEIDLYDDAGWRVGQEHEISLSAIAASGTYDGVSWSVGESQLAQTVTFVLMHKGLYELVTPVLNKDGTNRTTCSFVCGMKDSFDTQGYINSSNTNNNSWDGSARRAWCNGGLRAALPSPWSSIFKQFKTVTAKTYNGTVNQTSEDYFALAAEKELQGSVTNSNTTEGNALTQFTYYETSANKIKKRSGAVGGYWDRSPATTNATVFCRTSGTGSTNTDVASGTYGISPFGVF